METNINIKWFKEEFVQELEAYDCVCKFFSEGDFGSLDQIEFNSKSIGGNVDFWGHGWIGIFVWDYEREEESVNILLEPHQEEEKRQAFKKLKELL